ncbi:hypothetical protein [Sphingomonas baiyangensis]|uniref:Uncharacterized protein n=1 Tax=Sphingomonas baiyangensis TaxID=2572576 RepID=A0A4U1L465_9SPHN|nr:hypothetical protein [Sphingomonas baiyangensis]TKD51542.1 hypothetical protein FBR43_12840 [Sphingomonas baiyangensis]
MMATISENEEPAREHDMNEPSDDQSSSSDRATKDRPGGKPDIEEAQEDAAHEREEKGGYQ